MFTFYLYRGRSCLCTVYVQSTILSPEARSTVHSSWDGDKAVMRTHPTRGEMLAYTTGTVGVTHAPASSERKEATHGTKREVPNRDESAAARARRLFAGADCQQPHTQSPVYP